MAEQVEGALKNAATALFNKNDTLANTTILTDVAIDRQWHGIQRQCHNFIARHLPSAGHLRFVTAVLQLSYELERVGDYAATIARESLHISNVPQDGVRSGLELMLNQSRTMLHQSVTAFVNGDAGLARGTLAMGGQMTKEMDQVFNNLVALGDKCTGKAQDLLDLFAVCYMVERVGNRALNICHETLFAVTGETKGEKVFNILFLDEGGNGLAQVAAAIAGKGFPASGRFAAAGKSADPIAGDLIDFMRKHGHDLAKSQPQAVTGMDLSEVDILVSLQGSVREYGFDIPFHSAFLEWNVGAITGDARGMDELYRNVALQIRQLMELLRGEEAA